MTPTEQLIGHLEALGMTVERILPARGYWTHMHQDVMRWTAHVLLPGTLAATTIGSWDTITTCARRGIIFDASAKGDVGSVRAKDAKRKKSA